MIRSRSVRPPRSSDAAVIDRSGDRAVRAPRASSLTGWTTHNVLPWLFGVLFLAGCRPGSSSAQCRVTGDVTDAERTAAEAVCRSVDARFTLLFGEPPPPGTLEFASDPRLEGAIEDGRWRLRAPSRSELLRVAGLLDYADAGEFVAEQRGALLAHELGHAMFMAYVFPDGAPSVPGQYGTPLPDLLEEAVAVWVEPDAARARRRTWALGREAPDLAVLLNGRHPSGGPLPLFERRAEVRQTYSCNPACDPAFEAFSDTTTWVITRRIEADGRLTYDSVPASAMKAAGGPSIGFYNHALLFVEFLQETGGSGTFGMLVQRMLREPGQRVPQDAVPGLPADSVRAERAWREWLRARRDST